MSGMHQALQKGSSKSLLSVSPKWQALVAVGSIAANGIREVGDAKSIVSRISHVGEVRLQMRVLTEFDANDDAEWPVVKGVMAAWSAVMAYRRFEGA